MKKLKVLIGCEFSGVVRDAFQRLGHDAWSCDFLETETPGQHYRGDIRDLLKEYWDIFIVHPECRYMANSGAKHLYINCKKSNGINQDRWDKMVNAANFFKDMYNAPVEHVAAENPIMLPYAKEIIGVTQSQIIHPWMFGHLESKSTCLWLRNLPNLKETNNVHEEMMKLSKKDAQKIHYMSPGPERWKNRSRTYSGIGEAMAKQWSEYVLNK